MSGPGTEQTASRIDLLPVEEAKARAAEVGVVEQLAELNIFRVLLHRPPLAKWVADLLLGLLFQSPLDKRLRELVIMRLGWATRSDYEWTQHWRIALDLGVSEADLLGCRDWQAHAFGPAERAVLAATDETLADGAVSPATWRSCTEHVSADPAVLVDLVAAIGLWRLVSGILRTIEIPLEDGVASWPPDGRAPQ